MYTLEMRTRKLIVNVVKACAKKRGVCLHMCVGMRECVFHPTGSAPLETSIRALLPPVMLCDGHWEDNEQKSCSLGSRQRQGRDVRQAGEAELQR